MRQAIAAAMSRSKREIPHYYLGTSIDMSAALAWLEATNKARPVAGRLLPGVLLLKVVALALRKVPDLNGHWVKGTFRPGTGIHVGWATSLRAGGLVAPAIHHADGKPLDVLMAEMRDVVGRARRGGLRSSELGDPTVTVTNLGETGVETVYGVIFPPQVALVGFGRMAKRPWCVDGAVMARPVVEATLSADHRASDGHKGALFLATVNGLLQKPEEL
jgi:pyruvate dehydrogenase E2 component (dihydrolipoamide acetyltransferase)